MHLRTIKGNKYTFNGQSLTSIQNLLHTLTINDVKADISRPEQKEQMNNREKAGRQGIALDNFRTQLLLHTLQRNIGIITAAKCGH